MALPLHLVLPLLGNPFGRVLFIHKLSVSTYCVPSTVLGPGNKTGNEVNERD
jgi:hypothetical protein